MLARTFLSPACAMLLAALAGCALDTGLAAPDPDPSDPLVSIAPKEEPALEMPAPKRAPSAREGSALVRAVSEEALYLADEDHSVVRRITLPIAAEDPGAEIPMPGAPPRCSRWTAACSSRSAIPGCS
jgi:hypothetical protein